MISLVDTVSRVVAFVAVPTWPIEPKAVECSCRDYYSYLNTPARTIRESNQVVVVFRPLSWSILTMTSPVTTRRIDPPRDASHARMDYDVTSTRAYDPK